MIGTETLQVFVSIIDQGSFTGAAELLGFTPSGISRTLSRLEKHLGVSLITRTTRRLQLTEEGEWFLARARDVLLQLMDVEQHMSAHTAEPAGVVRVNAATPVLNHLVAPWLSGFMERYPRIRLELSGEENIIDLIEQRADVALRVGDLVDSTLSARRLGSSPLRIVASPDYLQRHGCPVAVDGLDGHVLLGFTRPVSLNRWPLVWRGESGMHVTPSLAASNGETLRYLALSGAGIACLAGFLVDNDIREGRLVPLFADCMLAWTQMIWAVFYKQGRLAPRVACFLDYLAAMLAR
jgi:DNA-binding transcriptional LysR family regulator